MNKYVKILVPTIFIGLSCVMVFAVFLLVSGVKKFSTSVKDYDYTLNSVFEEETIPVINASDSTIIKPYINESVKIGKTYYDYESESNSQENSLIYYENTYIQNNGVDYICENEFDVVSILDGKIISIETSEVYGNIITVEYNDNLKVNYSNVDNILVNVGYEVSQGEIIASSSISKLDTSNNQMLHFEVYFKGNSIDPENLYTMMVSELE